MGGRARALLSQARTLWQSKTIRQTGMLSAANFFAMGLGFLMSLVLPKLMGAYDYGLFSLCSSVVAFAATFFEFGIFASAAKVLVDTREQAARAAVLAIAMRFLALIAIVFAAFMWGLGHVIDAWQSDPIGGYLVTGSYFSVSLVLTFAMTMLLKATNEIRRLAMFNVLSKLLYVIAILCGIFFWHLSVTYCYLAMLLGPLVSCVVIMWRFIRMPMGNQHDIVHEIFRVNREFGIRNYFSRAIGALGQQSNSLLIGWFCGAVDVGLFSLCVSFASPVYVFASAASASKFRSYGGFARISKRFLSFYAALVCGAAIVCVGIALLLFSTYYQSIYGDRNLAVLWLLALGGILQSLVHPYNEWLSANGRGKEMLITGTIFSVVGLLANFVGISLWGIAGAGLAAVLMQGYFFVHTYYFYRKLRKET